MMSQFDFEINLKFSMESWLNSIKIPCRNVSEVLTLIK